MSETLNKLDNIIEDLTDWRDDIRKKHKANLKEDEENGVYNEHEDLEKDLI